MASIVRRLGVCVVCVLASASASAGGDEPPSWGSLEAGPYSVGFRSFWAVDESRTYDHPALAHGAKRARPVVINLWYPAASVEGERLTHGEYLEIAPRWRPELGDLASELADYELDVISEETLGDPVAELDPSQREALDSLLATPTASVRDAAPAPGPFPLVLYHAGYGSSFEDNAVLCEYLASRGFIVAGSAFLDGTGESFNIDAELDSESDLRLLIRVACDTLPADWERIGMVGHSGGAHTAVRFMSRASTPLDAVVLLDTTQDYHSFADHRWDDMVPLALENADRIDMPLLFAARQHALFRLGDRLLGSRRLYLTFRDLEHNSFIAQGVIAADVGGRAEAPAVREEYEELCRAVALFLDAELGGSETARRELDRRWAGAAPGVSSVYAETGAVGEGAPEYDELAGIPPTPRQFAALLDTGPASRVGDLLERYADDPRAEPFAEAEFAISVVYQLVEEGREEEARALLGRFATDKDEILRLLGAMGAMYQRVGATQTGGRFMGVVEALTAAETPTP